MFCETICETSRLKSSSFAELQYLWHLVQTLLVLWNYFLKNVVFSHAKLSVNFCIFNSLISTLLVICETFPFKPSRFSKLFVKHLVSNLLVFKTICGTFRFNPSSFAKIFVEHFVSNLLAFQNYLWHISFQTFSFCKTICETSRFNPFCFAKLFVKHFVCLSLTVSHGCPLVILVLIALVPIY